MLNYCCPFWRTHDLEYKYKMGICALGGWPVQTIGQTTGFLPSGFWLSLAIGQHRQETREKEESEVGVSVPPIFPWGVTVGLLCPLPKGLLSYGCLHTRWNKDERACSLWVPVIAPSLPSLKPPVAIYIAIISQGVLCSILYFPYSLPAPSKIVPSLNSLQISQSKCAVCFLLGSWLK